MGKTRIMIVRTAGTNCEHETAHAWRQAGAEPEMVHISQWMDQPKTVHRFGAVTFPGGFSYGDDISAGKILADQVSRFLLDELGEFIEKGGLVLGICNGFQALVKMGVLPGPPINEPREQVVSLVGNDSGRFEARWTHIRCSTRENPFLPAGQIVAMPVANSEGRLVVGDEALLDRLHGQGHVAAVYCDGQGGSPDFPADPSGSQGHIAGLFDRTGRVLGLMPHPERNVASHHHPLWTRDQTHTGQGLTIFANAVRYCQGH